jgi:hypothetical protein
LHAVDVRQVSLADGTAIDPSLLSFDSGFHLATVPEPSSLVLLASGVAGLLAYC